MPPDHVANQKNGAAADKLRTLKSGNVPFSSLQGRTTTYPIYEIDWPKFLASKLGGDEIITIVKAIAKDEKTDNKHGYRRADHNDETGNMPVAPGAGVTYREYHIEKNGFASKGYPRLVADIKNKRLYLTPTHYDTWYEDGNAQAKPRNAFFLLRQVRGINPLFD